METKRAWKGLANYAQRRVCSLTGTSAGRVGCVIGQTVNLRGKEVDNMRDINIVSGRSMTQYSTFYQECRL